MKLAAVVLLARPEFRASALLQVRQQTEPHIEILVEGVTGVSRARNEGLGRARAAGADSLAFFDEDDLYAPEYLTEVARGLAAHPITGKPRYYLHDAELDEYWRMGTADTPHVTTTSGGTLSFWLEGAEPFCEDLDYCEDLDWCLGMSEAGKRVHALSPNLYLKRQFPTGHTFPLPVSALVQDAQKLPGEPDWRSAV